MAMPSSVVVNYNTVNTSREKLQSLPEFLGRPSAGGKDHDLIQLEVDAFSSIAPGTPFVMSFGPRAGDTKLPWVAA
jgi:hypothetical protein